MNTIAEDLVDAIDAIAQDAADDEPYFIELVIPSFVAACAKVVTPRRLRALFDEALRNPTPRPPAAVVAAPAAGYAPPCWKFMSCASTAQRERWYPETDARCWKPVCDVHTKGATPMELRPLTPSEGRQ